MLSNIKSFLHEKVLTNKSLKILAVGLTDKFLELALTFFTGIIVIRCLKIDDYAIVGILAGYSTIINFFAIAPENYLLKVWGETKEEEILTIINSYFIFDIVLGGVLAFAYFLLGILLYLSSGNIGFLIVGASHGLTALFTNLYNLFRLVLEIKFRQRKLLMNTIKIKSLSLIISFLLFWKGTLWMYFIKQFITIIVQFFSIYRVYKRELAYEFRIPSKVEVLQNIRTAFIDFALINHVIGCLTNIIYSGETIFMSWFMGLTDIGQYNVALTAINYLVIPFQIIQKYCSIELSISTEKIRNLKTVKKYVIYAMFFQGTALVGYFIFGKFFIALLTGNSIDFIYSIGLMILIGTAVYNIVRPVSCYLIYKTNLFQYCLYVIIPALVFNCVSFYFLAKYMSVLWVAAGNIIAYSVLTAVTLIRYYVVIRERKCMCLKLFKHHTK